MSFPSGPFIIGVPSGPMSCCFSASLSLLPLPAAAAYAGLPLLLGGGLYVGRPPPDAAVEGTPLGLRGGLADRRCFSGSESCEKRTLSSVDTPASWGKRAEVFLGAPLPIS